MQAIPVAVRITLHSPQWGEIEHLVVTRAAIIMILTTKTRNGTGRGAGIAGGRKCFTANIHFPGGCSNNLGERCQPAGAQQALWVQRQCRKLALSAQSEPEK